MKSSSDVLKTLFKPSSCGTSCSHSTHKDASMDKLGLWSSLICSIHCLATPIVLAVFFSLKVSNLLIESWESVDMICLFLAPIFAWFSLKHGLNQHGSAWPSGIFSFGFLFLTLGVYSFSDHANHSDGHLAHTSLMILGGLLVALSHTLNLYLSKSSQALKQAAHQNSDKHSG